MNRILSSNGSNGSHSSAHQNGIKLVPSVEALAQVESFTPTPWLTTHADEVRLVQCISSSDHAFDAVLAVGLTRSHLKDPHAHHFFAAAEALHAIGTRITCETLAEWLEQASANEAHNEQSLALAESALIARGELSVVPKKAPTAKEAETIARRLVPKIKLLSWDAVLEEPDPEFLIEHLLVQSSTALLSAKHKSFKSFLAVDMALCIATGKPYHGFKVNRPGCVLYIAAEGSAGLKRRVQAWLAHHSETLPADRLHVINRPVQLCEPAFAAELRSIVQQLRPGLIIIDTLARCTIGLDENSAADMGRFMDVLGELAATSGACVMAVHHNNKSGDYRGSSALPAAVDTHLSCERKEDIVTLKVEKQKDAEEHKPILFESRSVPIPSSKGEVHSLVFERLETRSSRFGGLNDVEQKVLDAFRDCYGSEVVSSAKWREAATEQVGISKATFHRTRQCLVQKQVVILVSGEESGQGKNAAHYQVAEQWR